MIDDGDARCRYCQKAPWQPVEVEATDALFEGLVPVRLPRRTTLVVCCSDQWFHRYGDMMTPNELRRADLADPTNCRQRDELVARYERAGIAPDQDPSMVMIDVPVSAIINKDGSLDMGELVDVAQDAHRLRMATPDDV